MKLSYKMLLSLLLLLFTSNPVVDAARITTLAKITSIQGEVQVNMGGEDKWVAATEGMEVKIGTQVKTGAKASCLIKWGNGNVLKLTPFTNMKIDRLDTDLSSDSENASLNLWTGKVMASAKKLTSPDSKFEVKTPTAIAGVRGTNFAVSVDADETSFVGCADGIVSVTSLAGGEVILTENQSTVVKKGEEPSAPMQMTSDEADSFSDLEDSLGVTLDIMQPVGNLETDTTPVTIKGRTDYGNAVTVNGQTVTIDEAGFFTAQVNLDEGVNHIKIEAQNKKGKVTTKTSVVKYRPVEKDTIPPILEIIQPMGGFGSDAPGCSAIGTASITCEIIGRTEPDVILTINGTRCMVQPDGSFSCPITVDYSAPMIEVAATDPAGNRTSTAIKRTVNLNKVEYIEISVSPEMITGNKRDKATVTVWTYNLLKEPVDATVNMRLSTTSGGALTSDSVTTAGGVGSTEFKAANVSARTTVTITAVSGVVSASTALIVKLDAPPPH